MNLVDGKILDTRDCDGVVESIEDRILATLSKPRIAAEQVIRACDRLVAALDESAYLAAMDELGVPAGLRESYAAEARAMFSGEALRRRMTKELGEGYDRTLSVPGNPGLAEQILPLGVLLHVAAGNADGLPAFSVLEGLLTGNINILKLPAAEGGVSVRILAELIRIEPLLAEYIYVFDYSSEDIVYMNKLIGVADAVVVWGGIEAVSAFRSLLSPNIKLIEWGHKVSFAYVTRAGMEDDALYGIAVNMASTGQLLCSSCQGIYLDTEDSAECPAFCERFLPLLEKAVAEHAGDPGIGIRAQTALLRYTAELETIFTGRRIFTGENCSLIACKDDTLEPAIGFSNAWVKPLPRTRLLKTLRPYRNYLQTAALLCGAQESRPLADLLLKTGLVRVCSGGRMSATYAGAPHDGEYPLRRYTKIASTEL
jgi:hypothetical protein